LVHLTSTIFSYLYGGHTKNLDLLFYQKFGNLFNFFLELQYIMTEPDLTSSPM